MPALIDSTVQTQPMIEPWLFSQGPQAEVTFLRYLTLITLLSNETKEKLTGIIHGAN